MITKIRVMLEYGTYCLWLYNEQGEIIGNDNPPEWLDDLELTDAWMAVSDLYDSLFINTKHKFRYVGFPDPETEQKLAGLIRHAMNLLMERNAGRYVIVNDTGLSG